MKITETKNFDDLWSVVKNAKPKVGMRGLKATVKNNVGKTIDSFSLNQIVAQMCKICSKHQKGQPIDELRFDILFIKIQRLYSKGNLEVNKSISNKIFTNIARAFSHLFSNLKKDLGVISETREAGKAKFMKHLQKLAGDVGIKRAIRPEPKDIKLQAEDLPVNPSKPSTDEVWQKVLNKSQESKADLKHLDLAKISKTKKTREIESGKSAIERLDLVQNQSVFFAKKHISEALDFAIKLDAQINELTKGRHSLLHNPAIDIRFPGSTYEPFKFDAAKWKETQINLSNTTTITQAAEIIEECRSDLLEALAEFNIDDSFFIQNMPLEDEAIEEKFSVTYIGTQFITKPQEREKILQNRRDNRFINKLKLPTSTNEAPFSQKLQSIFKTAHHTLKGSIAINSIDHSNIVTIEEKYKYMNDLPQANNPYYALIELWNLESRNWISHHYYRNYRNQTNRGRFIQIEHLLDKAKDERMFFSGLNGEENVLLRFSLRYTKSFRTEILRRVLANDPKEDLDEKLDAEEIKIIEHSIKIRNQLLERIKKDFGDEFYNQQTKAYFAERQGTKK